jgi:hypothetical protein
MGAVVQLQDALLCRQRRAALDLTRKAELSAQCVALRALDRGLSIDVADRIAEVARNAVLTGTATPGRAIGAGYTRVIRLRRSPQPGDAA